jgi:hypothetical protein
MARQLTDEEKKARAEARKAAKEAKEAEAREEVKNEENSEYELLKAQNEAMKKQMDALMAQLQEMQKPQIIQVATDSPNVHLMWQAEVADDNVVAFGDGGRYGTIKGKRGEFFMRKTDFSTIMDERMRFYLANRWLIVLDGLTQEEREAYEVDYKDGEYLDKKAFAKMIEIGADILNIYPNLCEGNKKMVSQRYADAFNNGQHIDRAVVEKLNEMSKTPKNPRGDFVQIVEALNRKVEGNE